MKNTTKKILAAISIIAVCATASVTAFAEYDPNKVIDPSNPIMTLKAPTAEAAIYVNGAPLANATTYESEGYTMVPVRAISEALGITVNWDATAGRVELVKTPLYVTFTPGVDGYTFARTAPMKVGKAPELTDSLTYVPLQMIEEIMGAEVTQADGVISISYGEDVAEQSAVIVEVGEEEILVNDPAQNGEVRLALHDELVITDEAGNPVDPKDLTVGMHLRVEYSEQMGLSLPPYNAPKSIVVLQDDETATDPEAPVPHVGYVTIDAVENDTVTVTDTTMGEVVLHVSDECAIKDLEGNEIAVSDLKAGQFAEVTYSSVMTASLPPQNTPISITLIAELPADTEQAETLDIAGTVKEVDEAGHVWVTCEDGDYDEMILIVSDDTVITGPDGAAADADAITAGAEITAKVSAAMTRSLPPQTVASEIHIVSAGDAEKVEDISIAGTVKEVDEAGHIWVTCEDGDYEELVLIVSDDTVITGPDGAAADADDITAGAEITAKVSAAMTRSLPPQTVASEIQIVSVA